MNNDFTDFMARRVSEEGPARTRNIPRRKKRRSKRKARKGGRY